MGKNKRSLTFIYTTLLLIAGCIEYEENLIIKQDGSGIITMTYGMPLEMVERDTSFTAEKVRYDLSQIEGISVVSVNDFSKDESKWVKSTIRFNSLESLGNIKNDQLPGFTGSMIYTDNNDGTLTFTKILGNKPKTPKPNNDQDIIMMKNMIGDIIWHYKIKLPMNVHDIEAGSGETSISGATVTWDVPLASFIGGQVTLIVHMGKRSSSVSHQTTVLLKNGSRIVGEVLSMTKNICVIRVGDKRERIQRKDIQSIEF